MDFVIRWNEIWTLSFWLDSPAHRHQEKSTVVSIWKARSSLGQCFASCFIYIFAECSSWPLNNMGLGILTLLAVKNLSITYVFACWSLSCVWLLATLWTVAHQASLYMGLSRQKYWSKLLFLSPGDLLNPGIELMSLASSALAGRFFTTSVTWEAQV